MDRKKLDEVDTFYEDFCFESMKHLKRMNENIMRKEQITLAEANLLNENMEMVIKLNHEM